MRLRAIDWVRGLVMVLMTVDHAGSVFDAAHLHGDSARGWVPGSPLPAGEFLTRWITHLCAPTFVLLAGASLALSSEKRKGERGQTRFIVTRGLFILALDPLWMSLAFARYRVWVFQVLYAIGGSMVLMAGLRRLPTRALLAAAVAVQALGELSVRCTPTGEPWRTLWTFLFVGGMGAGHMVCAYPLVPWLSMMLLGWVLGRWLVARPERGLQARTYVLLGMGLLAAFAVVRGIDRYGNWNLHRDSLSPLQWLHVAKYPPSLAYTCLELGLAFLGLAGFTAIDDPSRPRRALAPLGLLGATAFFYYVLHVHVLALAEALLGLDTHTEGLAKTWTAAAAVLAVLYVPCMWYRRYKAAHPDGWARYI
jgi:uncharacterized membrane protein